MKKYIGIIFIMSLLTLAGCDNNDQTGPVSTDPFIGGTEAVSISFLESTPPDYIFDNGKFPFAVNVKLENLGESNVENGYVEIIGINPVDFSKTGQSDLRKDLPMLTGTRKNFDGSVIDGATNFVEFSALNYKPDLRGNSVVKIRADVCYGYETLTTTKVCIKENLLQGLSEGSEQICDITGDKEVQNSKAPVHISTMRQQPVGENKINFIFVIEKVGNVNDQLYKQGTECKDLVTNTDKNKIFVEIANDVNGKKPVCNGLEEANSEGSSGYVTLFDGKPRTVQCTLDITGISGNAFEDDIEINLKYNYHQYIQKEVEVRDVSVS